MRKEFCPAAGPAIRTGGTVEQCAERIRESIGGTEFPLITMDGPCASGKTTAARKLAEALRGFVIHTDDFVIPHAQKTAERLAIPGGNCDAERLLREVILPWKSGRPVRYRRYDCRAKRLRDWETAEAGKVLILEGSYCNLPVIREHADVRIFVDTPPEIREERLKARESPESYQRFQDMWIPLENAYFSAYGLPDPGCLRLKGC